MPAPIHQVITFQAQNPKDLDRAANAWLGAHPEFTFVGVSTAMNDTFWFVMTVFYRVE